MSEIKHTPGPWANIGNGRIHGTPAFPGGVGYGDGEEWQGVPANSIQEVCVAFPAQVYAYSRGDKQFPVRRDVQERWWARNKANIDLICSAPELLEALKELFHSYKELADSGDAGNWKIENQPEGKKALAAIAKAEGRAPDLT